MREQSNACNDIFITDLHEPYALGISSDNGDLLDRGAEENSVVADKEDIFACFRHTESSKSAGFFSSLHGQDALAATALDGILIFRSALAETFFGDSQKHSALDNLDHIDQHIIFRQINSADTHAASSSCAYIGFTEADALAEAGRHDEFVVSAAHLTGDQLIAFTDRLHQKPAFADVGAIRDTRLLDQTFARSGDIVAGLFNFTGYNEHRGDLFTGLQLQEIDNGDSF